MRGVSISIGYKKIRRKTRWAAALLALAPVGAQTPAPPSSGDSADLPVIRISVNLVQLDAVVIDPHGKQVKDLKKSDFEILQDKKLQAITNFSYVDVGPGAMPEPPMAVAASRSKGLPPPPAAIVKVANARRTVAVLVDDLGLSFASIAHIRSALNKFVDEDIEPGDLVAIIQSSKGMGALQQFTTDKRLLHVAIGRIRFNGLGRVGVSSFAPLGSGGGGGGLNAEWSEPQN